MPVPVLSTAQMREWEKATWAAGVTEISVIENVGRLLARRILELAGPGDAVLILAGKGHNGEDARQAQSHLSGRKTILLNVTEPSAATTELETALKQRPGMIVDGLFGIGLNRALDESWARLIRTVNASGLPVLAVDVPSGLNADTGKPFGEAVRADMTFTVGAPKTGLLAAKAAEWTGRLEVAPEIGLLPWAEVAERTGPPAAGLKWVLSDDFNGFPPRRPAESHKGAFGHLAAIAGSMGFHGAAVLAARGALRAQPGLVSLYPQESVYHPVAAQSQAAMVHPWTPGVRLPETATAILMGPGLAAKDLSPALKNELRSHWNESPLPVVADASCLDWLPPGTVSRSPLRVMTPHPGEAARLLKWTSQQVQADRPAALRELSRRYGNCWVVLKGRHTLVGRAAGDVLVNGSGNPHLAQGGSGDVLAGYIAGWLAQPALQSDPQRAIAAAVWKHGAAADRLSAGLPGWTAEDLAGALR